MYRRGEYWYIDYYFEDKRIREKVGPSRKEARDALGKRLAEIREGKFFDRRKEVKVKFEEFVPEFLKWSRANKLSSRSDETSMAHLIKHFKGKYLYQITSWQVEKYKAERVKVVSQATVNRELASLKTFFNKAIQAGKAGENPVSEMTLRYAHLALEHKQKAVKIMDSVIYSHKSVTKPQSIPRVVYLTP